MSKKSIMNKPVTDSVDQFTEKKHKKKGKKRKISQDNSIYREPDGDMLAQEDDRINGHQNRKEKCSVTEATDSVAGNYKKYIKKIDCNEDDLDESLANTIDCDEKSKKKRRKHFNENDLDEKIEDNLGDIEDSEKKSKQKKYCNEVDIIENNYESLGNIDSDVKPKKKKNCVDLDDKLDGSLNNININKISKKKKRKHNNENDLDENMSDIEDGDKKSKKKIRKHSDDLDVISNNVQDNERKSKKKKRKHCNENSFDENCESSNSTIEDSDNKSEKKKRKNAMGQTSITTNTNGVSSTANFNSSNSYENTNNNSTELNVNQASSCFHNNVAINSTESVNGDNIDNKNSNNDTELLVDQANSTPDSSDLLRNRVTNLFSSLHDHVTAQTMEAVNGLGFSSMTEIQCWVIPPLLEGNDVRATAKTGSGKTLAFLLPAVELLHSNNLTDSQGSTVVVLSPTRELAMQTYSVAQQLLSNCPLVSAAIITGGSDRTKEAEILNKGVSLLIATPGRLLDHLSTTEGFCCSGLKCLVLDEADKMLEAFEQPMQQILKRLPKQRQTMLFSATKTSKTEHLVKVALKDDFVDVDVTYNKQTAAADNLRQLYLIIPLHKKFLFLLQYVSKFRQQHKVMVFLSTCDCVKFYHRLLAACGEETSCIHGKMKQWERSKVFESFSTANSGTLLCTNVAARGWDIPDVDWVLQFDPPRDVSEYIHRVGRTARAEKTGSSLLLLRKKEKKFVKLLQQGKLIVTERSLNDDMMPDVQEKVEKVVSDSKFLSWWAKQAYKSVINAYAQHHKKNIFNIFEMDVNMLCKSFGLKEPPYVELAFEYKRSSVKKVQRRIRDGFYKNCDDNGEEEALLLQG